MLSIAVLTHMRHRKQSSKKLIYKSYNGAGSFLFTQIILMKYMLCNWWWVKYRPLTNQTMP